MQPIQSYQGVTIVLMLSLCASLAACSKHSDTNQTTQKQGDVVTKTQSDQNVERTNNNPAKSTALAEKFEYEAHGNEPFWLVGVQENQLIYKTPDTQEGVTLPSKRQATEKGVSYTGSKDGTSYNLSLSPQECFDDMSGEAFDMTAIFTYGKVTYNGCAEGIM